MMSNLLLLLLKVYGTLALKLPTFTVTTTKGARPKEIGIVKAQTGDSIVVQDFGCAEKTWGLWTKHLVRPSLFTSSWAFDASSMLKPPISTVRCSLYQIWPEIRVSRCQGQPNRAGPDEKWINRIRRIEMTDFRSLGQAASARFTMMRELSL